MTQVKQTVVLHVGPHKTGSTYLQKVLATSSSVLSACGVCYPEALIGPQYGHHRIPKMLRAGRASELRARLIEAGDPGATLLLSSENFDRLEAAHLAELRKLLDAGQTRVVYFVRNAADLVYSLWQEEVKHGGIRCCDEFALEHFAFPFRSRALNHRLVLDAYAEVFGRESLRVVDYDAAVAEGDLFDAFCRASELEALLGRGTNEKINRSFAAWEVELIRALNILARDRGRLKGANVRTAYLAVRKDESVRAAALAVRLHAERGVRTIDIGSSHVLQTLDRHCRKVFPEVPSLGVGRRTLPLIAGHWMLNAEATSAIHEVYRHLEATLA